LAHTVANALKLVELIDAPTPVFAGCAVPLVRPAEGAAFVHGADGFGDTGRPPPSRRRDGAHAADALRRFAHERPGATLVALAPLTNLALALRLDPELPSRFGRLVVMAGAATGRGNTQRVPAEFNAGFDPEAAHVVFSSWPEFDLVDWEACVRHAIGFERFDRLVEAGDERARFYAAISRTARRFNEARGRDGMVAADALAMAVALAPELVRRAERHHVGVELDGTLTRGATVVDWEDRLGLAANARIVLEVDQARFEALVAGALGAA
ncbi:MAG TPA: nucleoside hydrolase, partial [Dokdonella sp.]